MKTTDDMKALGALGAALAKAQGEFGAVTKNAKNPHLRNRYADLESVMAAVSPALAANGLGGVGDIADGLYGLDADAMDLDDDLDEAIAALADSGRGDPLGLRRLKKQKLALKDEIARIEDRLIPDIIA